MSYTIEVTDQNRENPLIRKLIKHGYKNRDRKFNFGKITYINIIPRTVFKPHLRPMSYSPDEETIITGIDVGLNWIRDNVTDKEWPEYVALKLLF